MNTKILKYVKEICTYCKNKENNEYLCEIRECIKYNDCITIKCINYKKG